MKFFPTSSLDKIDPPSPFIHATNWNELRSQFQSSNSQRSGYRNSLQAANALNQVDSEWHASLAVAPSMRSSAFGLPNPFMISLEKDARVTASSSVDACFCDGDLSFLTESMDVKGFNQQTESQSQASMDTYDLELGLLESVQDLAISLVRTSARRSARASMDAKSVSDPINHSG